MQIQTRLVQESSKSMWKRINRVTKKPHPGPLMGVEREIDGKVVELTEEIDIVENTFTETQDRFSGADDAPLSRCEFAAELGDFGYSAVRREISSGIYPLPSSLDRDTAALLQEIGEIGQQYHDSLLDIVVTPEEF